MAARTAGSFICLMGPFWWIGGIEVQFRGVEKLKNQFWGPKRDFSKLFQHQHHFKKYLQFSIQFILFLMILLIFDQNQEQSRKIDENPELLSPNRGAYWFFTTVGKHLCWFGGKGRPASLALSIIPLNIMRVVSNMHWWRCAAVQKHPYLKPGQPDRSEGFSPKMHGTIHFSPKMSSEKNDTLRPYSLDETSRSRCSAALGVAVDVKIKHFQVYVFFLIIFPTP